MSMTHCPPNHKFANRQCRVVDSLVYEANSSLVPNDLRHTSSACVVQLRRSVALQRLLYSAEYIRRQAPPG